MLENAGNFDNLRIAAGLIEGNYRGYNFIDSDIYKWLEAVAWEMGKEPHKELSALANQAIELIQAAQRPDGYLNSYVQTSEYPDPWADLDYGHELYCARHLFHAFHRAMSDRRLLNVALSFADHICSVFGPGKRHGTSGHPQVEMTLVELYRLSGERRYLEQAAFFIDQRGRSVMKGHRAYGPEYHQDHIPVREATEATGHAVHQLYLASGVTDLYLEAGEQVLLDAMQRLSKDIVKTKLYITGGMGSRFDVLLGSSYPPGLMRVNLGHCKRCPASILYHFGQACKST